MGDAAALITAITGLITALSGLLGLLLPRMSKKRRRRAARDTIAEIAKAAEDGVITVEELRQISEEDP